MPDGMENLALSQGPSGRAAASTSELISAFFRGSGLCIYGPIHKGHLWGSRVCENRRFRVGLRGVQSY